jgi:two-component system, LytTR family, sensor kinase
MAAIPKTARARILALSLGLAAIFSLAFSTQTYLAMLDHGHAFWRLLAWQAAGWTFWALAAPWVILRLCAGLGGRALAARDFARLAGVGVALVAAHVIIDATVVVALQPYVPVESYTFEQAVRGPLMSHLLVGTLLYGGLVAVGRMIAVGERARRLALREAQLEADLTRARLDALRLEIQPHFLFNTLNSIAALIRVRSNDQALKMLLGLSDLMRATLERAPTQVTPLPLEIAFTRGYVELQQVRFGERLEVGYAIAPEAEACLVPAFLLQPIVENAFRHGIGARAGRCRLEIGAALTGGRLRLTVRDDGAGLPGGFDLERDAGTGLGNVRTRLRNLYGDPASMTIAAQAGGGTLVTVEVPPQPPADAIRASA